jgi:hypothetical protein
VSAARVGKPRPRDRCSRRGRAPPWGRPDRRSHQLPEYHRDPPDGRPARVARRTERCQRRCPGTQCPARHRRRSRWAGPRRPRPGRTSYLARPGSRAAGTLRLRPPHHHPGPRAIPPPRRHPPPRLPPRRASRREGPSMSPRLGTRAGRRPSHSEAPVPLRPPPDPASIPRGPADHLARERRRAPRVPLRPEVRSTPEGRRDLRVLRDRSAPEDPAGQPDPARRHDRATRPGRGDPEVPADRGALAAPPPPCS